MTLWVQYQMSIPAVFSAFPHSSALLAIYLGINLAQTLLFLLTHTISQTTPAVCRQYEPHLSRMSERQATRREAQVAQVARKKALCIQFSNACTADDCRH